MAVSPLAPSRRCHVRSISLPSRSHPDAIRVEKELLKVRSYINQTYATPEMMQYALRDLAAVYESIEEVLCLPSNQAAVDSLSEKIWLEMELDESVRLMDLYCALKDSLTTKKEHIQDLQMALRRRDSAAMQGKATAFVHAMKRVDKDMKNRIRLLKYVDNKSMDNNSHLEAVAKFLWEVRSITISLLHLVSSFFSTQSGRQTSSRWSLVTKALSKRKVSSDGESVMSGFEKLDLFSSYDSILHKDVDEQRLQKVQNQLHSMEVFMEGLETGLESLFRQIIHIRVALPNSLST